MGWSTVEALTQVMAAPPVKTPLVEIPDVFVVMLPGMVVMEAFEMATVPIMGCIDLDAEKHESADGILTEPVVAIVDVMIDTFGSVMFTGPVIDTVPTTG
jgi:hypothetical protein